MSKRCELQKEYYQSNGNYKGNGKYSDEYVRWLEDQILALRIHDVVGRSEQLKAFADWLQSDTANLNYDFKDLVDEYLKSL
jgi:hypothetical protein